MPFMMPEKIKTKHSKHGKDRSVGGSFSETMKVSDASSKHKKQANQKRLRSEENGRGEKVEANTKRQKTTQTPPVNNGSAADTALSLASAQSKSASIKPEVVTVKEASKPDATQMDFVAPNEPDKQKKKRNKKKAPVPLAKRLSAFKTVMEKTSTQTSGKELGAYTDSDTLARLDETINKVSASAKTDTAVDTLLADLTAAIFKYRQAVAPKQTEAVAKTVDADDKMDIDDTPAKTPSKKTKSALGDKSGSGGNKDTRKSAVQVSSQMSEENKNKSQSSDSDADDDDDDSSEESSEGSDSV